MSSGGSTPPRASTSKSVNNDSSRSSSAALAKGNNRRQQPKDEAATSNNGPSSPVGNNGCGGNNHGAPDGDLFSFLSAMHLSNGGSGGQLLPAAQQLQLQQQQATNRKRKFLEQGGMGGGNSNSGASANGNKLNGRGPPFMRRGSDDEEHALHTPQCSQSGYADEEDRHHNESAGGGNNRRTTSNSSNHHNSQQDSPGVNMSEIDLAANFDDSLSGLGVDINSSNYMSEALLALPNLSISSSGHHIFKQEATSPNGHHHGHHRYKDEPLSRADSGNENTTPPASQLHHHHHQQNYGALDLSNDEAHLPPDSNGNDDDDVKVVAGPRTFIGSVSRDSSRGGTPLMAHRGGGGDNSMEEHHNSFGSDYNPKSSSGDGLTSFKSKVGSLPELRVGMNGGGGGGGDRGMAGNVPAKMTLPPPLMPPSSSSSGPSGGQQQSGSNRSVHVTKVGDVQGGSNGSDRFQYILHASTSLATKISDPTITYLNQGQSYELRLKKLGDLSSSCNKKKYLRCTMRICFHERRLRYMENEQIAEWRNSHPGERILYADLPLSYGVADVCQDPGQLNVVSFKWDPTRDTGIFVKVNCISTEFTPKKHGGEKGVPFRLQVETFEGVGGEESRLHAGGCILQVFKLKGADRKHKQDRDKISKRPSTEQEKFAPSYECTVLTDLSMENIYVPPTSRPATPLNEDPLPPPMLPLAAAAAAAAAGGTSSSNPSSSRGGDSPGHNVSGGHMASTSSTSSSSKVFLEKELLLSSPTTQLSSFAAAAPAAPLSSSSQQQQKHALSLHASVEAVTAWLNKNRYGGFVNSFRNFNGRDMLRLMREEVVTLCGLSDGIRLYNDLHMVVVAPRTTFYVAQKDTHEYSALFLEETTVQEFVLRLAQSIGVDPGVFARVFIVGPHGILLRVSDSVVAYTKPETVFQFSLRQNDQIDSCDVILENVSPLLEMGGGGAVGAMVGLDHEGLVLSDMQLHHSSEELHKDSE